MLFQFTGSGTLVIAGFATVLLVTVVSLKVSSQRRAEWKPSIADFALNKGNIQQIYFKYPKKEKSYFWVIKVLIVIAQRKLKWRLIWMGQTQNTQYNKNKWKVYNIFVKHKINVQKQQVDNTMYTVFTTKNIINISFVHRHTTLN